VSRRCSGHGRGGQAERALELLDHVVNRFAYEDVVTRAYACAVAIHCDLGKPEVGIRVGRRIWNRTQAAELGNALVRAYWEQFDQTREPADREEWIKFNETRESEIETDGAVAAASSTEPRS
jgi:hypothetical protein